jgi:hypothetical protein
LTDFANGKEPFLWIYGRPGLSKTESIRAATAGKRVWTHKDGALTPIRFYVAAYRNRGVPLILDDADELLEQKGGARLVRALADTSPAKEMNWDTETPILAREDVPPRFYTNSPLCVIANKVTTHDAIMSRATALVHFDPTNREIHDSVAAWFWDGEIYNWFGDNLHQLKPLDVRWYATAAKDKRNGRDWRNFILNAHAISKAESIVQAVEREGGTFDEKVAKYLTRMKSGSRATYARARKQLEESGRLEVAIVPRVDLSKNKRPGKLSVDELDDMTRRVNDPNDQQQPVEERPLDLPAGVTREAFAAPITGTAAAPAAPTRPTLDDTLPWEQPDEDQ